MLRWALSLTIAVILLGCSETEPSATGTTSGPEAVATHQDPPPSDRRHVILVADPWCPHNCLAGAAREGYMIDIAREVLNGAGYTVEYRNFSWARALRMTRNGDFNAVVGAFHTDAPDFIFPDQPQGHASISLFTHADSTWTYQGPESLESQTLMAINDYSYTAELDDYIQKNRDNRDQIWILSGSAPLKRALQLLEKDRTDVFAADDYVVAWAVRNDPDIAIPRKAGQVSTTYSYVAFSPALENSRELARVMSEGTRRLMDNGRVKTILESYGLTPWPDGP